jgi:hypothetical protein
MLIAWHGRVRVVPLHLSTYKHTHPYTMCTLLSQLLLKRITNQQPYYSNKEFARHAAHMHRVISHK